MNPFNANTSDFKTSNYSPRKSFGFEVTDQVRDSLMFIVEKFEDTYRFVICHGSLLQKFGYDPNSFNGKRLEHCLPSSHAIRRVISYDQAWKGHAVTYEDTLNGIPYMGSVSPVYDHSGEITKLQGFCVDMSEKKRVEELLKKRENYFRTLVQHHPDGIFTLNRNGEFLFNNPEVSNICGYPEEELSDNHFLKLIVPEEKEAAINYFKKASKGELLQFDTVIYHKNGHRVEIEVTNIPIMIENEVHSVYGIVKDISELRKNQKEVHFLKNRISSSIYHSADSIAIFDMNNHLVSANPAFEKFFGWKESELMGKRVPYVPEELVEEYTKRINDVKRGRNSTNIETTRIRKDGTKFYVSVTLSPLKVEDGKIVGYTSITRDIHAQKVAEHELRNKNQQYKIITEHTMDLINVFDSQGKIKYSSPSHKTILGYEDLQDRPWTDLVHPDDLPDLIESIKVLKETQQPIKTEFRLKNAHGDWIILESYGTAVLNCQKELDSIVTISRDITERKTTEDFLRKSEKLAVLGQLAAGIAHEIRNPLTSLKGFTHLLKVNATPEESEYYQIMLSELERINTIVGEFMMLAKPQPKNTKRNDLRKILQEAASLLEAQANLHNIQFVMDFDVNLEIDCEADQLKQVCINLMKNGMEAMEESGGLLFIKAIHQEDTIIVSFKDEGCGIPKEQLNHIGEPFYTTKEKGTGLGMMICNKIMENHNGLIEIESELNQGTTVKLVFPK
ncbi:PAS domain-containing sensor histidine kinase [Pseudalkalibacillus berkeleyi]|uniref:histidine kinase n=1 Tax=Pseudalkalibacillus berkeleyi TaxID=1069813 RepID=A0ABS9H4N7_9BACL|nr:PAS domain-containing sensor histidine kinase [Pseudalkalibacillus berkeleyi]MCF6138914.1 PAS domain S-box protein [Pseudalkalibacillus berkeleyi]